jgi:hypothetical protein
MKILDNFTRQTIYNLYKEYVEAIEENGKFVTYTYFTRAWKKYFNNVSIPKKMRMGFCNTCASLKERRDKTKGVERSIYIHK